MDNLKRYSSDFDRVMTARLKGQDIIEATTILGISIYLAVFLESTNSSFKDFMNSKLMTAVAIGGCLTIVNHKPMLSLMIAVAYLAALSVVNKKSEAEKFAAFSPSLQPDFVTTYENKVQKTNDQMAAVGNSYNTLSNLYPESKPVNYELLAGNQPWAETIGKLKPLERDEDY